MNLITAFLELLHVARTQLEVHRYADLTAQRLLLEAEAKTLKDCHVVWLSHHDEDTLIDQDVTAYRGTGWYTMDESGVLSSGPHTSFVKAAFESGRYVGAEVGTAAMATMDLCHIGTSKGKEWVQRLDHFHRPRGPRYFLGAADLPVDQETLAPELIHSTDNFIQVTPPGKPIKQLERPEGLPDRDARSPEQLAEIQRSKDDLAATQVALDQSIDFKLNPLKPLKPLDRSEPLAPFIPVTRPLGIRAPSKRIIMRPEFGNRCVGTIVAVGRWVEDVPPNTDPMMVPQALYRVGDRIAISSYAGSPVTINGDLYLSVKRSDIIVLADADADISYDSGACKAAPHAFSKKPSEDFDDDDDRPATTVPPPGPRTPPLPSDKMWPQAHD